MEEETEYEEVCRLVREKNEQRLKNIEDAFRKLLQLMTDYFTSISKK